MRPIQLTTPAFPAADPDFLASSQTPSTAGPLTLNAVVIAVPAYVTIKSVADETGKTFTVTGTRPGGGTQSEAIAGGNNATVTTTLTFETVTSVTVSAATAGAIEVGLAQAGYGDWIPLEIYSRNQVSTISATVSGTINYSIQYTNEDPFDRSITQQAVDHPDADLVSETTNKTDFTTVLMRAVRWVVNSGSGTARITITQQSIT